MTRSLLRFSFAGLFIVLALPLVSLAEANTALDSGQVTVVHKRLMRDGRPWVPHGFFQIGFAVPPGAFHTVLPNKQPINPVYQIGYTNYAPQEYAAMRSAGADSVRLNISQSAVDHQDTKYFDPQFVKKVIGAVHAARAAGLSVIIAAQDETQGDEAKSDLPDGATRRFWKRFAPLFGRDRGVLFELYNEPGEPKDVRPSGAEWKAWAIAMDGMLKFVRNMGAVNVIVVDGLAYAQQLAGAPVLNDPLKEVVYAAHPYPHNQADQERKAWNEKFGNFAQREPTIITEWGPGYFCNNDTPKATLDFLTYLQERQIGLEVVAWDWGTYKFASAIQNFPDIVFSSFKNPTGPHACSAANGFIPGAGKGPSTSFGLGRVIKSWYLTGTVPKTPE
jgi:endoglucanase